MKVLEENTKKWSMQINCAGKGCKVPLEIEQSDISYRVTDEDALAQQYKVDVEGTFSIICPRCGQQTKVKNIPPAIKTEIMGE